MTEMMCNYSGDRDQAIVSYLYDAHDAELDPAERAAFESHLTSCDRCREDLAAFSSVRASLGEWSPPRLRSEYLPSYGAAGWQRSKDIASDSEPRRSAIGAKAESHQPWWREIPVWAQAAAALLFLGVGAGLANLDIRYDAEGLRVRTGWLAAPAPVADASSSSAGADAPWRVELTALEERLRADVRAASSMNAARPADSVSTDVLRRVRALVEDSEQRQQRELALRLAEAMREVGAQRQADLIRIDRNIGAMQNSTGLEMLRQRNEMLVRTASQRAR